MNQAGVLLAIVLAVILTVCPATSNGGSYVAACQTLCGGVGGGRGFPGSRPFRGRGMQGRGYTECVMKCTQHGRDPEYSRLNHVDDCSQFGCKCPLKTRSQHVGDEEYCEWLCDYNNN